MLQKPQFDVSKGELEEEIAKLQENLALLASPDPMADKYFMEDNEFAPGYTIRLPRNRMEVLSSLLSSFNHWLGQHVDKKGNFAALSALQAQVYSAYRGSMSTNMYSVMGKADPNPPAKSLAEFIPDVMNELRRIDDLIRKKTFVFPVQQRKPKNALGESMFFRIAGQQITVCGETLKIMSNRVGRKKTSEGKTLTQLEFKILKLVYDEALQGERKRYLPKDFVEKLSLSRVSVYTLGHIRRSIKDLRDKLDDVSKNIVFQVDGMGIQLNPKTIEQK